MEGSLNILAVVLDDDVRRLIKQMLESPDCHILAAADEAEAVEVACSVDVDLLLIDAAPPIAARSIAERLCARTRELPVVYVTGWFDHPDFADLKSETIVKAPFSRAELKRAIDAGVQEGSRR